MDLLHLNKEGLQNNLWKNVKLEGGTEGGSGQNLNPPTTIMIIFQLVKYFHQTFSNIFSKNLNMN